MDADGPSGVNQHQQKQTPEDKAEQMIREAEENRIKVYGTPGNFITNTQLAQHSNYMHSAMVDEAFMIVASHLDETTINKIKQGEYVDFAKLLPKDRVKIEEETELKMIIKNGRTFYVKVQDGMSISGFGKWEAAFRIYSNIYTTAHPNRASELIQYNHIIHMASLKYIWDNVYMYDKDFRLHLSKYPNRSWAIILQQSWSLRLQDRLRHSDFAERFQHGKSKHFQGGSSKAFGSNNKTFCKFNRGKCNFGASCKYDHRCSYCNKFGHPSISCCRAIADRSERTSDTATVAKAVKEEKQ